MYKAGTFEPMESKLAEVQRALDHPSHLDRVLSEATAPRGSASKKSGRRLTPPDATRRTRPEAAGAAVADELFVVDRRSAKPLGECYVRSRQVVVTNPLSGAHGVVFGYIRQSLL